MRESFISPGLDPSPWFDCSDRKHENPSSGTTGQRLNGRKRTHPAEALERACGLTEGGL